MSLSRLHLGEDDEERDAQLERLLKRLLEADPVDVPRLRLVAASHGLLSPRLRARCWCKLLGADPYAAATQPNALSAAARAAAPSPDAATVAADVARCAWLPREGLEGDALAVRRTELRELVDGALALTGARYFQGLHDIAAVLLLTAGGPRAGACLVALLRGQCAPGARAPPQRRSDRESPPPARAACRPPPLAPAWSA
jgi:hypothetical protein